MKQYTIEKREDGDHWISLEALRDSITAQRASQQLSPFQTECLMMAATLIDALLLEAGVEREDTQITLPTH